MLVSVIVATYNSERYITETLESIKDQTYQEIELIVTDDHSGDKTIEVCRSWLGIHSERFLHSELLTVQSNTGTSANCNRGLLSARGDWIKFCAGDDTLKRSCIEDNVECVGSHPEIRALFSRIDIYKNTFAPQNLIQTTPEIPYSHEGILAEDRTAESQHKMLLLSDRIHFTPSVILHRETLLSVGGFDERFRLLEDHPLWLNLTENGHKLYFMEKVTVNYRIHSKAVNNTGVDYLINPNYFNSEDFRRVYTYPKLPLDIRLSARFVWLTSQFFRSNRLNNNIRRNRFMLILLTRYLNPFNCYIWVKKRINKGLEKNEFYM